MVEKIGQNVDTESLATWVLGGIVAVVTSLAAAVTTLWNRNEHRNAQAIKILTERAIECEESRTELRIKIVDLEHRIEGLEKHG